MRATRAPPRGREERWFPAGWLSGALIRLSSPQDPPEGPRRAAGGKRKMFQKRWGIVLPPPLELVQLCCTIFQDAEKKKSLWTKKKICQKAKAYVAKATV